MHEMGLTGRYSILMGIEKGNGVQADLGSKQRRPDPDGRVPQVKFRQENDSQITKVANLHIYRICNELYSSQETGGNRPSRCP